jgi:hypothetical protein
MTAVSFGEYLVQRGVVSTRDVERATEGILLFGGRLGTHLVEAGTLSIGDLERHLSDHLSVPLPPESGIERPDPSALAGVPRPLVERHKLLPFRRDEETLHVAMADPWDPDQGEALLRITGLRVRPYLLSELRLDFLLEKHYGIPRRPRGADLGRAEPAQPPSPAHSPSEAAPAALAAERDPALLARRALGILPLDPGEELIDARDFERLYASYLRARVNEGPAPGLGEGDGEAHDASLGDDSLGASQPTAVLEPEPSAACEVGWVASAVLRIARVHTRAVALFVVRDSIEGLSAAGEVVREDLRGLRLALSPDDLFGAAALSGAPARGSLHGVDRALVRALGASDVGEAVVLPIRIRQRVVNLLYADAGPCPIGEEVFALLDALCERVAEAYGRIILDRKRARPHAGVPEPPEHRSPM